MSSIIRINNRCNHNCVFCSAYFMQEESDEQTIKQIEREDEQIVLTGGEPLMKENLLEFIEKAREQEPDELELQTNGSLLSYNSYARKLVRAGVDLFNVNFPSHREEVFNEVTQTSGHYEKVVEGIENLLEEDANVRLTKVVTSKNTDFLEYVKFIENKFPEVRIIELNTVKVMGKVKENMRSVPSIGEIHEELIQALEYCEKNNLNVLVDGVPLCYMQGYEHFSVDLHKILNSDEDRLHANKEKTESCGNCSLNEICLGFREGYPEINGDEARPRSLNPKKLRERV